VRQDAATQETVLATESEAAQRKRAAGYLAEELAAQQSLEATKRAHAEEIALVGVGGEARVQATAHSQITDRYQAEIDRLNADIAAKRAAGGGTATKDDEDAYAKRLALLQDFQTRSLAEWDDYYAKLKVTESDATLGFQKGLADYETSIGSVADRTAKLTGDGFKSLEDILVAFATTGKLSFASLENTILAGIARIAIQEELLKPLAAYLGGADAAGSSNTGAGGFLGFLGLLGGGSAAAGGAAAGGAALDSFTLAPGLATGGRALPGGLYPVTERGPEVLDVNGKQYLMTGNSRANVTPVASGSEGMSQRPIQIIQQFPGGASKTTVDQAAARAGQAVRKALSRG
jgi:lambda family phage tail tape measure protein